ncbi:hypothetical protein [Azospirillum griseum]|uniref:Methyl-accepting transducer domain-containing protein n=1 Tax=Azospirillum griseum TaxID=2496639 RepID=A0A3S0K399_9PROT|nr:hypothetical protein [Azospirillum griseum]RTR18598.1 hypothetical protein EJ903_15285 [Azospirillum griseum]
MVAIPSDTVATLRALSDTLARVAAPIEGAFAAVGGDLGDALAVVDGVGGDFQTLSAALDNPDGVSAVMTLTQARQDTMALATSAHAMLDLLAALDQGSAVLGQRLATLSTVIGEVTALAINAKVQAAQIRAANVDFSVFSTEIDRLHGLANSTTQQASERLTALRAAITTAHQTATRFQVDNARALDAIGAELNASLKDLSTRRTAARDATRAFAARVADIRARTAQCIVSLQTGDMTRQRLEHIRHALDLLGAMLSPGAGAGPGLDWLAALDDERKATLLSAVCDLQARQFTRTRLDFSSQIQGLQGHLQALARETDAIANDARRLFHAEGGSDRSFVGAVAADVDRAIALLANYRLADARIREQVVVVSDGFAAMARNVSAISSIDADMRIMALNTTFKCARLGDAGKALGVVAQELRACSRRTEEASRAIADAIGEATTRAATLNSQSARDHQTAAALTTGMTVSMAALKGLEQEQDRALSGLTARCVRAAALLQSGVNRLTLDSRLEASAAEITDALGRIVALVPDHAATDRVQDDVLRLLAGKYTMASERIVHDLFATSDSVAGGPSLEDAGGGEVDFF